jgi:hypothetical protein
MSDVAGNAPEETPLREPAARPERRHPVLRALMFGGGGLLILAGFLLGFVPFMPGFPLGLLGIGLLAASSMRVRRVLRAAVHRLPSGWRWRLRKLIPRRPREKTG